MRVKEGEDVVAIRLRQLRVVRQWTQEELAARADVKQSQVSAWEGGRRSPDIVSVRKLARAFEMSQEVFAREIGYIEIEDDPAPPRVVVVHGPTGVTEVPIEQVVAYVESFPDQRQQDRLARWREIYDTPTYQRLCARLYVAWHSNLGLVLGALEEADVT